MPPRPGLNTIMTIEATQLEKAILLKVAGRMDAENANEFDQACDAWISRGSKHVIADLSELQYVSSMGLRSFLLAGQKLQSASGSLILCGLRGLPRQVFEMTKLIDLFPVYETTGQAIATL
jgi:anti-sigma B factor antagonist